MSEQSITVSDGEAFYRIPVSDLEEACADGFYLPLIHNLTIVSNGEELFGVGQSKSITKASIKALVSAINRSLA